MKISGIVFDKDGTLMDIQPFWVCIVKYAAKQVLRGIGLLNYPQDLFLELLTAAGIQNGTDIIPEGLIVKGTNEDIAKAWEQILIKHRFLVPKQFCSSTRILLGSSYSEGLVKGPENLRLLLGNLKAMGLKLAVATSDDLCQTEYCLKQLNIQALLYPVMTADNAGLPKPYGDMMHKISEIWNVPTQEIIMVGDSENDMLFAKNSNAIGIYLNASNNPLPQGAMRKIGTLRELPPLLNELKKLNND